MNGIEAVRSAWARVFGSRIDAQFISRLLICSMTDECSFGLYAVTHQAGNARLARPDSNRGTSLRGRVLYPAELRAIGGLDRIRTDVTQLCRLVPNRSVTGPQCPRPDSNGRPAPS